MSGSSGEEAGGGAGHGATGHGGSAESGGGRLIPAPEVRVGDVLRSADGTVMRVDRIEPFLFEGMIAFVEDSEEKWFKLPARLEAEVTLLSRAS